MKIDLPIDFDTAQSILDFLPMGVCIINREQRMQWANKRIINRIENQNSAFYKDKHCFKEIFHWVRPCSDCPAMKTLKSGLMEHMEIKNRYKGEWRYYLVTATPLRKGQNDEDFLIIETIQDITYQKKADEELRRLSDFNAAIIDNAPAAIFTIDRTGKFISVNPALALLSGLGPEAEEKLVGFNWLQNPYTVRSGLAEHIKKGLEGIPFELQDFPYTTYRGDRGQYIHFRGVPLRGKDKKVEGLLCIIEDNTEKVKAKIQSIQDAKMTVIGRLMTGVAHELNNPLAAIAANSELACELFQTLESENVKEGEMNELREYLEVVQEQAFRCKNIIKDMIDLTRKKGLEVQDIDMSGCLNELITLINFRKKKIRLNQDIAVSLPHVRGDLNAVKQSFMNILQNAVDAVEGREGGVIGVKAYACDNTVRVEIKDNGVGIHDELVDKIFEPFFSTKDTGKGVGLGLTLCYEFLNRMGGNVEVESALGRGSLFRVTLPVYTTKEDHGNH